MQIGVQHSVDVAVDVRVEARRLQVERELRAAGERRTHGVDWIAFAAAPNWLGIAYQRLRRHDRVDGGRRRASPLGDVTACGGGRAVVVVARSVGEVWLVDFMRGGQRAGSTSGSESAAARRAPSCPTWIDAARYWGERQRLDERLVHRAAQVLHRLGEREAVEGRVADSARRPLPRCRAAPVMRSVIGTRTVRSKRGVRARPRLGACRRRPRLHVDDGVLVRGDEHGEDSVCAGRGRRAPWRC